MLIQSSTSGKNVLLKYRNNTFSDKQKCRDLSTCCSPSLQEKLKEVFQDRYMSEHWTCTKKQIMSEMEQIKGL